jgi:hypothetical protein
MVHWTDPAICRRPAAANGEVRGVRYCVGFDGRHRSFEVRRRQKASRRWREVAGDWGSAEILWGERAKVIPIAVTAVRIDTKSLKVYFIRSNACPHPDHYCEAYSQFDQWSGCLTRHQHPIQFHRSAAPQAP